ncbi:imidazolonepropionase [Vibrio methylphosphonaticus]|uniref:imidazolonepropionase n=1 Tax=Vibrio methylphosphonaticus TaxID=2946866 RepID=UPI002029CBF1|nr:imidazolonepropionase [Vibrio methylphosphonaticus]MCL9773700.1 imidazolonepropionase [Vibrio methylphosphonaticus]
MNLILTNAKLISMVDGTSGYVPSKPSSVVIENGVITRLLPECELALDTYASFPHLDCKGAIVTPGFIDPHTHLVFGGNRAEEFEARLQGESYESIAQRGGGINTTVIATRAANVESLIALALPRLDSLIKSGCTSVEIKSGYGLTLEDEAKMLIAAKSLEQHRRIRITTTLLAAHAVPIEFRNDADGYIEYVVSTIIPYVAKHKLADAVDVFCESIGFDLQQTERVFKAAVDHGLAIKGHTEQLSNLGGTQLAAQYHALSADHIEYLDETGVLAIAQSGTVATLLPGAFYFLRETQLPPIQALRSHKVPMALGSDLNPGTSPFADLRLTMNMACILFRLTPEEALRGVTCHAARAIGQQDTLGKIAVGFTADLAIWDIAHPSELSYQLGMGELKHRVVSGVVEDVQ